MLPGQQGYWRSTCGQASRWGGELPVGRNYDLQTPATGLAVFKLLNYASNSTIKVPSSSCSSSTSCITSWPWWGFCSLRYRQEFLLFFLEVGICLQEIPAPRSGILDFCCSSVSRFQQQLRVPPGYALKLLPLVRHTSPASLIKPFCFLFFFDVLKCVNDQSVW